MNKPFVPVILFYCLCTALFGFVRAAEKTLNVELAFVKAALPAGAPITAKPKVQTVLMNCVIVEDGVEFEIILGGDDLWQMTSTNSFLQLEPQDQSRVIVIPERSLPEAIPNPDPDAGSGRNEMLNFFLEEGISVGEGSVSQFILDRPFVLQIGYFAKSNKRYSGEITINPEDWDSYGYHFVTKASTTLQFPLDEHRRT